MHSFIRDEKGVVLLEMKRAYSCKCWKGCGMIKKVTVLYVTLSAARKADTSSHQGESSQMLE
jgi:hypothetical protein